MAGGFRVIGLTGPVASGKSAAAAELERRGAGVLDLDRIGHQVLADPGVRAEVEAAFPELAGPAGGEGADFRRRLAEIVFADPGRLARLERILHPRMCEAVKSAVEEARAAGWPPAVVIEGALLFEMGLDEICNEVVLVDAPREARLERARRSRGWSEEDVARREARQLPLEGKRLRADRVVDNRGTEEELRAAVAAMWEEWSCQ